MSATSDAQPSALDEPILADDYPIYADYLYVADGKAALNQRPPVQPSRGSSVPWVCLDDAGDCEVIIPELMNNLCADAQERSPITRS